MKKIVFLILFLGLFCIARVSSAEYYFENISKFKDYNPDGQKYEFIQDYITSLSYLYSNEKREQDAVFGYDSDSDIQKAMNFLSASNLNLRIARNYLKKYLQSDNKLIRKATDMLNILCDEQIELNKSEYAFLDSWKNKGSENELTEEMRKGFLEQQKHFMAKRKDSLAQLLEATLLATKILISPEANQYGDLAKLSLTENQRQNVLKRLSEEFEGSMYEGDIREGQSFLQASVVMLRVLLEDQDWETMES